MSTLWPTLPPLSQILSVYLFIEIIFYIIYLTCILPRANTLTPPEEFHDYGRDRHKLMVRILDRMERTCEMEGKPAIDLDTVLHFFYCWFDVHKSSNLPSGDDRPTPIVNEEKCCSSETRTSELIIKNLLQDDFNDFMSWAFFGREFLDVQDNPWMMEELDKMYDYLKTRYKANVLPGKSQNKEPRRMTLEKVRSIHRPLIVYSLFWFAKSVGWLILYISGYRFYTCKSGLGYWYRPDDNTALSKSHENDQRLPLLYFHGIAPCGLFFSLPLILKELGCNGRKMFLFENPPVTHSFSFKILTEEQTISGVREALHTHLPNTKSKPTDIIISGHSFGSCQITWLLRASKNSTLPDTVRIRQIILLDPVSILLSEPDVVSNFLYNHHDTHHRKSTKHDNLNNALIHYIAATEVFTQHYLRRHFSWYNSELWLEDVISQPLDKNNEHGDISVLVVIAEKDEIVDSIKVLREIRRHNDIIKKNNNNNDNNSTDRGKLIDTIVLKGVGHGHCIMDSGVWKQVGQIMEDWKWEGRWVK